ncbi:hypothetical protein [Streptomyces cavernicola]|uniref:Uncharacterized protein n=1 Tax=Streptomyces cavernicola TaxID=3043613 RepID=A0ABT6SHJ2_9ACTN|nr:hypothetical protein [Streptomyces sp. B-S-A6]MDI3407671.1 hypothetical protein [Streptomyces sp. B-S-A6]
MTRYGFAIKALPKGGKPFGDDEDQEQDTAAADDTDIDVSPDSTVPDSAPADRPAGEVPEAETDPAESPKEAREGPAEEPPAVEDESSEEAPPAPEDDARPWSGDMYDAGDETEPSAAFAAYKGANGEDAWLDQAPDGTLTGWVRDATGQVWRYTNPDVWAIDVDDAQMPRTHSQANGESGGADTAGHGGQDALFPPKSQEPYQWS